MQGTHGQCPYPFVLSQASRFYLRGTPQSSLSSAICEFCIFHGLCLAVKSPLTGTIGGYTWSVSVPIRALSGEYVLIHGTPQSSLSLLICDLSIGTPQSSLSLAICEFCIFHCSLRQVCPDLWYPTATAIVPVIGDVRTLHCCVVGRQVCANPW